MSNTAVPNPANSTLRSASVVFGLLPQLAGLVAGLSALALLAGWREASAYYSELGAPWATGMLAPTHFFLLSASIVITIGMFTVLSVYWLTEQLATATKLCRWSLIILVPAGIFVLASLDPWHWFSIMTVYLCAVGYAHLIAAAAGLTVGELIASLAEQEMKWHSYHVWLMYWVVFVGLLQAPDRVGTAKALLDGDLQSSKLPVVSIVAPVTSRDWRLVTTINGSFLVVALTSMRENRAFRVLGANEIAEIRTSHAK